MPTPCFNNICFNDGAFINYLRCINFILNSEIKKELKISKILKLRSNYNKALNCLLDLQITINGKKTIWAQQYDPITLLPTVGRSFEKISLCSLESAQVVIYLISLPNPNNRIKNAIISACEWFYQNKIMDYEQIINNNEVNINYNLNNKRNLYSRYYSLENNSPIFFDRSGNEYNLNSFNTLDSGLRNGYTWLGCWGDYLYEIYSFWKLIY